MEQCSRAPTDFYSLKEYKDRTDPQYQMFFDNPNSPKPFPEPFCCTPQGKS